MLNGFLVLLSLAWAAIIIWAIIVWIRVGTRWLQLHPAPSQRAWVASTAPVAAPATAPAASPSDVQAAYAADLRVWASTNEPPSALAQRLGVGAAAASQVRDLAIRAASATATDGDWQALRPWLPRLLDRD